MLPPPDILLQQQQLQMQQQRVKAKQKIKPNPNRKTQRVKAQNAHVLTFSPAIDISILRQVYIIYIYVLTFSSAIDISILRQIYIHIIYIAYNFRIEIYIYIYIMFQVANAFLISVQWASANSKYSNNSNKDISELYDLHTCKKDSALGLHLYNI